MEKLLIDIYLFVCRVYDTSPATCYQRLSNNREPEFTDQELVTIWFFVHLEGCFEKKRMYRLIENYWREWFPRLPSYQTFVRRLNRLEPTLQTLGATLSAALAATSRPQPDLLVDSVPVMLARHGHSYRARVGRLPLPAQVWLCAASHHDSKAFIEQQPEVAATELFGDLAYPTPQIITHLRAQQTRLVAPRKKPKGKDLTDDVKYYNRLVRRIRQPIESLFNWIEEKTGVQRASKVRSTDALMIHCWGKLAVAFFLLVFNY